MGEEYVPAGNARLGQDKRLPKSIPLCGKINTMIKATNKLLRSNHQKMMILLLLLWRIAVPTFGQVADFKFLYLTKSEGLLDNQVYDIQEDFKGRIWIATQRGASCFNGETFKNYLISPVDSVVWKDWGSHFLTTDATGRIWLAMIFKLFYFDEKHDKFIEYDLSGFESNFDKKSRKEEIYLQDWKDKRSIWFRKEDGIYSINCDDLTCRRALRIPVKYQGIWKLLGKDMNGNIAFRGGDSSVITFFRPDGSSFSTSKAPSGVGIIYHQPGSNQIWVSGDNLMSYDQTTGHWEKWSLGSTGVRDFTGMTTVPALTGDSILWMYSSSKTTIAFYNTRQKRFIGAFNTNQFDENGLRCGLMQALFVDSNNNIWLGGNAGVSILFSNRKQFERYAVRCPKGTMSGSISTANKPELYYGGTWKMPDGSLAEWVADGEKLYYIALSNHSKAYFEGKRAGEDITGYRKYIDLQTGQRTVTPLNYRKNKQGDWFESIAGSNLAARPRPLSYCSVNDNKIILPRGENYEPEKDVSGTWFSSGILIYYFQDGDSIISIHPVHIAHGKKVASNRFEVLQVRWWGGCRTEMKVILDRINPDSLFVSWKALDSDCDLEKGETGSAGIKRFNWQGGSDSIFIHTFRIFDKIQPIAPIDFQKKAFELEYTQNFITFEFDCANPEYPTLWYKLEGFDHDWFQTRTSKQASYTNLEGGDYVFRVKAIAESGQEMEQTASFRLYVKSPYYRTNWFYILCIVSIGGFFYAIFRYREIQRLRQEQIRLRIARDLHDEVGSTLSNISILSALALESVQKDLDAARLSNIGDKARSALDSMRDVVWSVNPENDSMQKVIVRMNTYASGMLEHPDTELRFEVGEGVESLTLSMERRKDFYLIFKEVIHNCVKYAQATHIEVRLRKEGNVLVLTVKDDGVGFDVPDFTTGPAGLGGNGLKNMYSRATQIGGILDIQSKKGKGTEIVLKVTV